MTTSANLSPAVSADFSRAISLLRANAVTMRGDPVTTLPWFLFIGPPGSGKSTTLRRAAVPDLRCVTDETAGGGAPTRNFDFWLAPHEAVLIETAGRMAVSPAAHPEWLALLEQIRIARPKTPINGLIIAVSANDITQNDPTAMRPLAQRLREILAEFVAYTGVVVPVYLVITQCDVIAGWSDAWGDLTGKEEGEVFGFTAPIQLAAKPPGVLFKERFEDLVNQARGRALRRMYRDRRADARLRLYYFPQWFDDLGTKLELFVATLFADSAREDAAKMRGVYFVGAPERDPMVRFARDLFKQVIFQDTDAATRTAAERRRVRTRKAAVTALVFLAAAGISIPPAIAFLNNYKLVTSTGQAIDRLQTLRSRPDPRPLSPVPLEDLRRPLYDLAIMELNGPPLMLGFGMYKGAELYTGARKFYNDTMRRRVIAPIVTDLQNQLTRTAAAHEAGGEPLSPQQRQDLENALETYRWLTSPRDPDQAVFDEAKRRFVIQQVVDRWGQMLGPEGRAEPARTLMATHAKFFVDELADNVRLPLPREPFAVTRARAVLARSAAGGS